MDRRRRSLLVQFWLTVESFKNPLESVELSLSDDEEEAVLDPARSSTLKEDIAMIKELYFSSSRRDPAFVSISQKHVDAICSFGIGNEIPSLSEERKVRRSVMLAQRQVEQDMEQDFEELQRSELWFRIVADVEGSGGKLRSNPSQQSHESHGSHSPHISKESSKSSHLSFGLIKSGFAIPTIRVDNAGVQPESSSKSNVLAHRRTPLSERATPPLQSGPLQAPPIKSSSSNLELLMSSTHDIDGSPSSTSSRAPLFDDPEDPSMRDLAAQSRTVEAIQAALTDIIALDEQRESSPDPNLSESFQSSSALAPAGDSRRRQVIFDDELLDDEDRTEEEENITHGTFQLAGPGDLQLSHEIARLTTNISKIQAQDVMLDTLIKKAELTGDAQELRLLRKSKSSLTKELRELMFQKMQYEQQESANRLLSDRTKVSIVNSTVGEEDGKSVVRYLIEVQQLAQDGSFGSGWVVARRYNEFFNMHNKLKDRYAPVRTLDFPGKRLVTSLTASFVDTRRIALGRYLQVRLLFSIYCDDPNHTQSLIAIPAVCESEELRAFLSRESPFIATSSPESTSKTTTTHFPGKGLVRSMYQSVAESIDDMFFGPSMLDVIIQRLTSQAAEFAGIVGTGVHDEDLVTQALRASGKSTADDTLLQLPGDLKPLEGETGSSTFSSPICDLILAVFELDKSNNWLRRQAIVIILQQVLGGTIERWAYNISLTWILTYEVVIEKRVKLSNPCSTSHI